MYAFVDESGNSDINLDHNGASKLFIITAVIVDDEKNKRIKINLNDIAKKYFSNGPIKSSSVGNDDKRRLSILDEISKLEFTAYTLIVNKELLYSKGFTYKASFYKFLNGKLHSDLYKAIPDLIVYHDTYGTDEFKHSFREYIKTRHTHDLFSESDFYFVKSQDWRQIQLADFICGSYARIYDQDKKNEFEKNYRELLSRINGVIEEWPVDDYKIDFEKIAKEEEDSIIEKVALHSLYEYIGKNENYKDDEIKNRVLFLRYLLYSYKYFSKVKYIYTKEIRNHLAVNGVKVSDYQIRSNIVAPLRDYGVLISSSSQGYKIPNSKDDITKYIQHSKSIIMPMIRRMEKVQKVLLLGSGGSIDIHNNYGFPDEIKSST